MFLAFAADAAAATAALVLTGTWRLVKAYLTSLLPFAMCRDEDPSPMHSHSLGVDTAPRYYTSPGQLQLAQFSAGLQKPRGIHPTPRYTAHLSTLPKPLSPAIFFPSQEHSI